MGYMLVKFGATWCGPCRASEPYVSQAAGILGIPFRIIDTDKDKNDPLMVFFPGGGIPNFQLIKDGVSVHSTVGWDKDYNNAQTLVADFQPYMSGGSSPQPVQAPLPVVPSGASDMSWFQAANYPGEGDTPLLPVQQQTQVQQQSQQTLQTQQQAPSGGGSVGSGGSIFGGSFAPLPQFQLPMPRFSTGIGSGPRRRQSKSSPSYTTYALIAGVAVLAIGFTVFMLRD